MLRHEAYVESCRVLCQQFVFAAEKRVDILINNAGILQTTRAVTQDGFEMNLGVNYLGNLTTCTQLYHFVLGWF